ncbi:NAD(P)-binding protein [Polychaeton citri CBS 116435]|uniref:NADP-dependent mannitol dehydrogenase n=1 Tax=Polychaeton citri CBS 116435 TaxID=1314669 RepID=A0A9P4UQ56_9PEZI|nr:NAD(P)-binding protein [Polychaeton citri CBS 116435]
MVLRSPTVGKEKSSPEDSSMKDGRFREGNTNPPKDTKIKSLLSLQGRTAIVSGGDRGIGFSVVETLAEAGANVAIWYNSNQKALGKAREIEEQYGVTCRAYQCNVTDPDQVAQVTNTVVKDLNGRLDIFIANAGVPWTQGRMIDGELKHFQMVRSVDFDGVFYCARAAGEVWRRQYETGTTIMGEKLENYSYGSFVATASMSGHIANIPNFQSAYNAAKAGVIHLVKSLAVEWVKFARANSVSPGYVATEISDYIPPETKAIWRSKIPMGRECQPHELKGAYLYLASDASSYTTGSDIVVDGGYTSV